MGVLLLLVGVAVLAFGLFQHLKGKRILAAPFKKTGELAKNPTSSDPKGAMSTEGKVIAPAQQLLSPCTKQPCLAWEVKVERLWEKVETTQDGTKTVKGSDTLDTLKGGTVFGVDDGTGALQIDVSRGADFDNYKEGFKKELNGRGWASQIQFGELSFDVPVISDSEKYTIGFKATEKYVPVEGSLFVLGKIEGGKIVKPGWRSLMTSSKGRDGLLGSINKKKKFSFIGGGVAAVLSIPLMIFAPSVESSGPSDPNHSFGGFCNSSLTGAVAKCSANVSTAEGESFTWTVTRKDTYDLKASPAVGKKIQLDPNLVLESATGEVLLDQDSEIGKPVTASIELEPGTYTVRVKDISGYTVKGGFSFDLEIAEQHPEPKAAAVAAKDSNDDAAAEKPSKKDVLKAKLAALKAKKAGKQPVEVVAAEPAPEPVVPAPLEPVAVPAPEPKAEVVAAVEPEPAPEPEPVKPAPVAAEPVETELEISAKNLTALAVEMNEACGSEHCRGGFQYIFTNLSCDKTARWCQLDLTAMERANHQAFVATLPFTPSAKTRSAFDAATSQAIAAFEAEPKSGRLTPVVMQAEKKVAKKVVLVEPLAAKKSEKTVARTVAVAPKAQPAPVAAPAPKAVKASPAPAAASPAPMQRANKNMAD